MSNDATPTAREAEGPSEESLREMPEIDFDRAKIVGRGLLAHMFVDGRPIDPGEQTGRFLVHVPSDLHRALVASARRNGVSLNTFVVAALASATGWPRGPEGAA
jgi:hypothetical protein